MCTPNDDNSNNNKKPDDDDAVNDNHDNNNKIKPQQPHVQQQQLHTHQQIAPPMKEGRSRGTDELAPINQIPSDNTRINNNNNHDKQHQFQ